MWDYNHSQPLNHGDIMADNELTKIRRQDRAITDDAWIADFLG